MNPTVTLYDPETETFTDIPESELAPGMMRVELEGRDGVVWVEIGKLTHSEYQHSPFGAERRDLIEIIQESFPGVYDKSYKFWEDGFRRDANPDNEIRIWLHIAEIYSKFAKGKPLEYRGELFSLVLACSNCGRERMKFVFESKLISDEEIEKVVAEYFES